MGHRRRRRYNEVLSPAADSASAAEADGRHHIAGQHQPVSSLDDGISACRTEAPAGRCLRGRHDGGALQLREYLTKYVA